MNDLTRFEKLTAPEKRGEYKIENLKKTKDEVIFICNFNMKVTAASAYCAGERLVAMKETMEYGKFSAWIEKEFPLSRRTAYRYMSFYERLGCATVAQLENISPAEALRAAGIIDPKKSQEENALGYNRIDLGGNPGPPQFDFAELFELPSHANQSLKNYRVVGDMLSEIVIVRRTKDNRLTSKQFAVFNEDIPRDPALRLAYKTMSQKTQAAIEDYLAALELAENPDLGEHYKKARKPPRKTVAI